MSPTWFATNSLVGVHQAMSETSPGADATSSPLVGWVVGTTLPTVRSSFDAGTEAAAGTFAGTAQPDGTIDTSIGDCLRTTGTYRGFFATGTWTLNFNVIGVTNSGAQDGRIYFRLLRSPTSDGAGATEITAGAIANAIVTNLSTTQVNSNGTTASITGFDVFYEYLFCQIAWEITGAGGMTTTDVAMRVGATATTLVSPAFTPRADIVATPKPYFFY